MAWNPTLEVAAARDIGRRFNKEQVIILMIDDKGQMLMATYGETKELCKCAGVLGEVAFDAICWHIKGLQKGMLLP